jgi:hypothetical protein
MKCSRELKNYISRFRQHLKDCRWDDLMVLIKKETCKKNKKKVELRNKKELRTELDSL